MSSIFHHRRTIRLQGFDYRSIGGYFVTLSTPHHADLFGIRNGEEVRLNEIGQMVAYHCQALPDQFPIALDAWMLMPNHLHMVIFLLGGRPKQKEDHEKISTPAGTLPGSIGAIVQNFKSVTTRKANRMMHSPGAPLWQRNYYERIIRNEKELDLIRQYIMANPAKHAAEDLIDF